MVSSMWETGLGRKGMVFTVVWLVVSESVKKFQAVRKLHTSVIPTSPHG